MRKIIVTGATGFLGKFIVPRLLYAGYDVYATCFMSDGPSMFPQGVHWYKTNLLDSQAVDDLIDSVKPEYLLHLAWDIKDDYRSSLVNVQWMNASLYLMHKFAQVGTRAVFAGTCFEYDLHKVAIDSHPEFRPSTLYGVCKNSLFNIIDKSKWPRPIEWAWARPFYIYGPHESAQRLIPSMINSIWSPTPLRLKYDGMQMVDYLYVDDVALALVELLNSPATGAFNICSEKAVRILKIAETICNLMDVPASKIVFGHEVSTPVSIQGFADRMRSEVGWEPSVNLERGLVRTISWWAQERAPKTEIVPQEIPKKRGKKK